jgi:hypothetical protein
MKTISLITLLVVVFGLSGCIFGHHTAGSSGEVSKPIITPDVSLAAKVVSMNVVGRFVVLGFPPGQLPKMGETLFIYNEGLKVAQVKITGPAQDNNIVADLVSGDAKVGDTVRDQ